MVNRFRSYSKGKSFKFSEWNELDTYNNDEFIQDWVSFENKVYVCLKNNTNVRPGTSDHWQPVLEEIDGYIRWDDSEEVIHFRKGQESNYSYLLPTPTDSHRGVYFAEDVNKIYMDGKIYGSWDNKKRIVEIESDSEGLILKYDDGSDETIFLNNTLEEINNKINESLTWVEFD